MKLPWVSRATYEVERERAERSHAGWMGEVAGRREDHAEADARFRDLLEKFTALRVAGAVPEPKPDAAPAPLPVAKPDELKALIDQQCGGDLRKRKLMLGQLAIDRAEGKDEDSIRKDILSGVQSEGVPS